jgi:hypothetical protein
MTDKDHPHLTLVDPKQDNGDEAEYCPLPYFPWDERPSHLPLDSDEAATAIHLAHGDLLHAASLLKVPLVRLSRLVRSSPRLERVFQESLGHTLIRAASIPIQTLFDPSADARRLEWASTKVLQSRIAMGHPLSPAPSSSAQSAALTVNPAARTITFRWRTSEDDRPTDPDAA